MIDKVGQLLLTWFSWLVKLADRIIEPWHMASFIIGNFVEYQLHECTTADRENVTCIIFLRLIYLNYYYRVTNQINNWIDTYFPFVNKHRGNIHKICWPVTTIWPILWIVYHPFNLGGLSIADCSHSVRLSVKYGKLKSSQFTSSTYVRIFIIHS